MVELTTAGLQSEQISTELSERPRCPAAHGLWGDRANSLALTTDTVQAQTSVSSVKWADPHSGGLDRMG